VASDAAGITRECDGPDLERDLLFNVRDGELGTPTLLIGGLGYAVFSAGLGLLRLF
jgi:hypothetical protein